MLNALKGTNPTTPITHASLHTADPGDTGATEATGGGYARQAVAFAAPSAGAMTTTGSPAATFSVGASSTITHVGFWSAVTGGTFLGSADVVDETFAGAGQYQLTSATVNLNA